jgi:pyrroline-5-carboxylate reductase
MQATVFLGGGRITGALIAGLRLAGYSRPIVVHDRHAGKMRELRREFRVEVARDLKSAVESAEMLIVAVRPGSVAELLEEIVRCGAVGLAGSERTNLGRARLERPLIVISLAAGIPLKKLRGGLGAKTGVRWARAMPSPVCRIGHGLTAVTFDRHVSAADRKRVRELFELVGAVLEIPERQFDAFCVAYSPSHGYHALASLAKAAQAAGLDRGTALTAGAHAFAEAILYWRESGQTLGDLLREAATPGGIAAATMEAMKKAGYEKAVAAGLGAGIRRARLNAGAVTTKL